MNKTRTIPTVSADHGWNWGWECWSDGGTLFERHRSVMKAGLLPEEWEEICDRVNDFLEDLRVEIEGILTDEDQIGFLYQVSDDIWDAYRKGVVLDTLLSSLWDTLTRPLPFQVPVEVVYD